MVKCYELSCNVVILFIFKKHTTKLTPNNISYFFNAHEIVIFDTAYLNPVIVFFSYLNSTILYAYPLF